MPRRYLRESDGYLFETAAMSVLPIKDERRLMTYSTKTDLAADTLTSTAEIAAFLGKSERQIVHLLWKRQIPAFKLGGRWHMRKSTCPAYDGPPGHRRMGKNLPGPQ